MQSIASARRREPERKNKRGGAFAPPRNAPLERGLVEQRQDGLRRLVGDRQSLNAQLLLDLQRLQRRAFLRHVGVDQLADTGGQRVGQRLAERRLDRGLLHASGELGESGVHGRKHRRQRGNQRRPLGLRRDGGGALQGEDRARQLQVLRRGRTTAGAVGRS